MKITKLFIIITMYMFAGNLHAEGDKVEKNKKEKKVEIESIFGDKEVTHGGYGAPVVRFGQIGNDYGLFIGGRGGWIINHQLVIGAAGYGHVAYKRTRTINSQSETVRMGYGGMMFEYYFFPSNLLHFSIGAVIGAGGIHYGGHNDNMDHDGDPFFVVEPEINAFVNISSFCRLGIGGSYRYVKGINIDGISDSDYRGFSAQFMVAFGYF